MALSSALVQVAVALGDSEASTALKNLPVHSDDAPLVPQVWLDKVASSDAICGIAGELPEKACQLFIDWIDAVRDCGHQSHKISS